MASAKDAVTDFLQLGAKYELILVGLYEDLNEQRVKVEEASRRYADTVAAVNGTRELMEEAARRNKESAETVRQVREGMERFRTILRESQEQVAVLEVRVRRQKTINTALAVGAVLSLILGIAL